MGDQLVPSDFFDIRFKMRNANLLIVSPNSRANQTKKINRGFVNSGCCKSIKILAFDRDEGKASDISYQSLGTIFRCRYFSRIINVIRAIWITSKEMSNNDVVFTWTLDCLIITLLAKLFSRNKQLKVLYNVRDIHPQLTKKTLFSVLLRRVDKIVSRYVDVFVFTSPYYFTGYYNGILKISDIKWVVLENKVPEELWEKIKRPSSEHYDRQGITIGYFGLMAYKNSWEIIKSIVQAETSSIRFYLRGHNYLGDYFEDELKSCSNVEYGGFYKNPEDLSSMFDKIDISWAINAENYTPNTNDQWAMCNRFYEGLYFKKPLIVQKGSAHSDFVETYDIGVCVDARNAQETKNIILNITPADIARWKKNIDKIDDSIFILSKSEYSKIMDVL